MPETSFVATIQILIPPGECRSASEAADWIHGLMDDSRVMDWAYLKIGGQYLFPTEIIVPDDYEEGELFS